MTAAGKAGFAVLAGVVMLVVASAFTTKQPHSNGGYPKEPIGPLVARGFLDAPAGTVSIANNPNGGYVVKELRVRQGQRLRAGEIVAIMAQDHNIEAHMETVRNNTRKQRMFLEKTLKGTNVVNLQLAEDELSSAIENDRLAKILRSRSGRPLQETKLEVDLAERNLANHRMSVDLSKRKAAIDIQLRELEITRHEIALEEAMIFRDESVVRTPISGVVTEIYSRTSEMVSDLGIVKVVDMTKLRVVATVDEVHLPRMRPDRPVEVTFRGSATAYKGVVVRTPLMVKREKRSEADRGVASVRQLEVEIAPADGVKFPEMIGREARVKFL